MTRQPSLISTPFFVILFFLFSCRGEDHGQTFLLPDNTDINNIVWTIITEDSLPVLKKRDTLAYDAGSQVAFIAIPIPFSVELRKIKVVIPEKRTPDIPPPHPPPPGVTETVSISELLNKTLDEKTFFNSSDSLYILFQNDTLRQFHIAENIVDKLIPTTLSEQIEKYKRKERVHYFEMTIPVFSADNKRTYVILIDNCPRLCGGAMEIFLQKINNKWIIVSRHQLWVN